MFVCVCVSSLYIYVEFLASLPLYTEIDRVGDYRRTVNTSTTPHISEQFGTKKKRV